MRKLKNILVFSSVLILLLAFNFQDNPSGWYQQFLPNINGRQIADMTFLDSLTGYIVTTRLSSPDTSYILKTTNGGDNWNIVYTATGFIFNTVQFLNQNTGFVGGSHLIKTTNAGTNWFSVSQDLYFSDFVAQNNDTLFFVSSESLTGGVFRTTNGGANWTQQLSAANLNPTHIYFYNKDIGFTAEDSLYKTTNSGVNWFRVSGGKFDNMQFVNELTGWKCDGLIQKTTNGGLNWTPLQGISSIFNIAVLNKDTIWGVGGYFTYPNFQSRGVLFTTTNGGTNWLYQVPDTSINIFTYLHVQFINKSYGWAYGTKKGIHTKVGGDPLTAINPVSSEIPKQFKLEHNYPNPFNPNTIINYKLSINSFVTLKVYDLQGKEVSVLVNKKQSNGLYSVEFNGANLSSGIYFYTIQTGDFKETKKMMLVK